MKNFWICRHGISSWNLEKRKQGHKNSPLTVEGIKQAEKLAKFFKHFSGLLFSSPLGRAIQTSKIIMDYNVGGLDFKKDDRLKEISFGIIEGMTKLELGQELQKKLLAFEKDPFGCYLPGGESYSDVSLRVRSFLQDIDKKNKNIVIIAHEDTNKLLIKELLQLGKIEAIELSHPHNIIYNINNDKLISLQI